MSDTNTLPKATTLRCKFRCTEVALLENNMRRIKLSAVYDPTIEEDRQYNTATPWGEFTITLNNPAAWDFYKPGACYYMDTIPVPVVDPK